MFRSDGVHQSIKQLLNHGVDYLIRLCVLLLLLLTGLVGAG